MVAPAVLLATAGAAGIGTFFTMSFFSAPLERLPVGAQIYTLSARHAYLQIELDQQNRALVHCYNDLDSKRADIDNATRKLLDNVDPETMEYYARSVYIAQEVSKKVESECVGLENWAEVLHGQGKEIEGWLEALQGTEMGRLSAAKLGKE